MKRNQLVIIDTNFRIKRKCLNQTIRPVKSYYQSLPVFYYLLLTKIAKGETRVAIDLIFLMTKEDYVLETESFRMKDITYYPLECMYFGAPNPTMLITWDAERDRIHIRFE